MIEEVLTLRECYIKQFEVPSDTIYFKVLITSSSGVIIVELSTYSLDKFEY